MRINLENNQLHTIAEDQIVIAENQEDMEYILYKLKQPQYMVKEVRRQDFKLYRETKKHVKEYECLGITFCEDGRNNKDIMRKLRKRKNLSKVLHPIYQV